MAIADYIETAMGRLHAQDVKMGNMIREKLGKLDAPSEQALQELDERLAGNQQHLRAFSAAGRGLPRRWTPPPWSISRPCCRVQQLHRYEHGPSRRHHGSRRPPVYQDDWDYMAGVTDEETRVEQQLYARVFAALPAALDDLRPAS